MAALSNTYCSVPETYKWPSEKVPVYEKKAEIPIIDMQEDNNLLAQHMMKAIQEFGCFQVINHGISRELMDDANQMFKELHKLPQEEVDKINKEQDQNNPVCQMYTSSVNYNREQVHYWRNVLRQCCHPLEECVQFWPKKPEKYREIIKPYVMALREMGSKILENIAQGLGLEQNYFANEQSDDNVMYINSYPACPDPSSTIGLAQHTDPSLLTILHSGRVPGLQLLKDGQWLGVDTPPCAFLVFGGNMLQVISNGKLKAAVHIVTSTTEARMSEAFFVNPLKDCIVEPATSLLEAENARPLYRPFKYEEFFETFKNGLGNKDTVLDDQGFKTDS
ncbi:hypothetical protein RND81_10G243900 [Saponaria officinalis]|uniref:Fe2OG dioxygenase domain-containing protein n=1 Tax=Saponaria officinalis TaxID=3572 RepID=A0AAW1I6V2_SAPOF